VFQQRAERIEAQLPHWGQELYLTTLAAQLVQEALHAWQHAAAGAERRFSVLVDSDLPDGSSPEAQAAAKEAATALLSLPWELLHDGHSYLFQGRNAVRVRRRLPNRRAQPRAVTNLPIRILLLSPRPETAQTGYIDHRISALPLVEAVESLRELAALTVLTPPTFPAYSRPCNAPWLPTHRFMWCISTGTAYTTAHTVWAGCASKTHKTVRSYKRGE
jgi:hypothetical protein